MATNLLRLLGPDDSGMTTIVKQMWIAYACGNITAEVREQVRDVLFNNLRIAFALTIEFIEQHGLQYHRPKSNAAAISFQKLLVHEPRSWKTDYRFLCVEKLLPLMEILWWDKTFQQALERGNEKRLFQQTDPSSNNQDYLRARVKTDGITQGFFATNNFLYEVFDMNGMRSGRRQWIQTFDGVDCVFFVASLAGYDRCLIEDLTANQLTESLFLFEAILSLSWFKNESTVLILILNKLDIFKRKIKKHALKAYFPDYVGREKDHEAALLYISARFNSLKRLDDERKLHIYSTDATNIGDCQAMLQDIEENVILKPSEKRAKDAMIGVAY
ncbi:MAG: hypothetical protein Q9213_006610 [Squamulea squamosa]